MHVNYHLIPAAASRCVCRVFIFKDTGVQPHLSVGLISVSRSGWVIYFFIFFDTDKSQQHVHKTKHKTAQDPGPSSCQQGRGPAREEGAPAVRGNRRFAVGGSSGQSLQWSMQGIGPEDKRAALRERSMEEIRQRGREEGAKRRQMKAEAARRALKMEGLGARPSKRRR